MQAVSSAIASHVPGRIRVRHAALRVPERMADLDAALRAVLDAVGDTGSVTANLAAGSLVICYDHGTETGAATETAILDGVARCLGLAPISARASHAVHRHRRKRKNSFSLTDLNQPVKIGMMASMAVSLLALAGNRRLHASAGAVYVLLVLLHMATYRRTLFR